MFPGVPVTTTSEQPSWNCFVGMDKKQVRLVWDKIKKDPMFWFELPPLVPEWEFERINELNEYHRVYFVTSRVGLDCKTQTEGWLNQHGVYRPTVIISSRKGDIARAVNADFSIDDKASNASCIAWMTDDRTKSYLLDRKYNQCPQDFLASSVIRIGSVRNYLDIINYELLEVAA